MPIKRLITVSSRDESRRALPHGSRLRGGHHDMSPRDGIFETRVAQTNRRRLARLFPRECKGARENKGEKLADNAEQHADNARGDFPLFATSMETRSKRREASPFPTRDDTRLSEAIEHLRGNLRAEWQWGHVCSDEPGTAVRTVVTVYWGTISSHSKRLHRRPWWIRAPFNDLKSRSTLLLRRVCFFVSQAKLPLSFLILIYRGSTRPCFARSARRFFGERFGSYVIFEEEAASPSFG